MPQDNIDHGGLVEDEQVALKRILPVPLEVAAGRVELQEAVDRGRLPPCGLRQTFRCPAGWGGQHALQPLGTEDLQDATDQRRFAHAGDHQDLLAAGLTDRFPLDFKI